MGSGFSRTSLPFNRLRLSDDRQLRPNDRFDPGGDSGFVKPRRAVDAVAIEQRDRGILGCGIGVGQRATDGSAVTDLEMTDERRRRRPAAELDAADAAIAAARVPFAITHAPGFMLVTDLKNAQLATSGGDKAKLYEDAQKTAWNDAPWAPLVVERLLSAHSKKLSGVYVIPDASFDYWQADLAQ